jgi:aerobic carbon-monoxide dehydrogenase medium subunit
MIPAKFDYLAPTSVEEALAALAEHGDDAKVIAGGQSLLPVLRMRLNAPEVLVDIGGIDALRQVTDEGDSVLIGAMVPYYELLGNDTVKSSLSLLHKAIGEVADPQIRHRGTLGGALVHADPAGDCGAPVLALDGEMVIQGSGGERTVAASDFFEDLFTTAVGEDELLTGVRLKKYDGWGSHYEKFVRVAHQWPIVAVAAAVRMDGGAIGEARIGLVNMGGIPLRAGATEQALVGKAATADGVREACDLAAEGTNPPSDLNGDADYRRHLATVLTRRAVLEAAQG